MRHAILKAGGLKKSFVTRGQRVEALRGVSLSIDAGGVLAFLGPNGAGKTTTIRILTSLVRQGCSAHRTAAVRRWQARIEHV